MNTLDKHNVYDLLDFLNVNLTASERRDLISELFRTLPVTIRTKSMADLLSDMCSWSDTPQDHRYWADVFSELERVARYFDTGD